MLPIPLGREVLCVAGLNHQAGRLVTPWECGLERDHRPKRVLALDNRTCVEVDQEKKIPFGQAEIAAA